MRAISNGAATDPTRALVDAIKESAGELEGYSVGDMTDDVEVAELIGRLKSLLSMLVAVAER